MVARFAFLALGALVDVVALLGPSLFALLLRLRVLGGQPDVLEDAAAR